MTPEERAESILKTIKPILPDEIWQRDHLKNLRELMSSQIREAVEEGIANTLGPNVIHSEEWIRKQISRAKAEAYEEAAKMIEASVNIKGIDNPDISLINCHLQSRHDAGLCRGLAKRVL